MKIKQFSPKQKRVLTWWLREGEYEAIICDGAVRSGKTVCMGISFFCWAMTRFERQQFALCAKTIGALRRNLLHELVPVLRQFGFSCEEQRSKNTLVVRCGGRENTFYLFGGRDASSASLIQGCTLAGVLFDEAALMPRSFVEQACARCSVSGSRLWFNCNPEGPEHWFYKEWILRAQERKALYLRFTMEDNPALSERIRARYASAYSGAFYRRFILGEWTAAEGLIYDFFDEEVYVKPVPEGDFEEYRISVDYGTSNPASFGLWARRSGVWYRIAEYYYDSHLHGRQKTDAEYMEELRALASGRKIAQVVVDPSAASFIEALRREGFAVKKAQNNVEDGIRVTADLLKRGRIVICSPCRDCLREIRIYCWEQHGGGRDVPRKENDHAMDEMRYFAMSVAKSHGEAFAAVSVCR